MRGSVVHRGDGDELHMFVEVQRRRWDPFSGIVESLKRRDQVGQVALITFDQDEADLVRRTEFSGQRLVRVWNYRRLLPGLRAQIRELMADHSGRGVVLYTADEGVWGEVVGRIRREGQGLVRMVNVQHGVLLTERAPLAAVRRVLNFATERIFGVPILGLGFGGSAFDVYLVYSEVERSFLESQGLSAIPCPELIKRDMLAAARCPNGGPTRALVALPACVPGSEIRCDLQGFIAAIAPLIRALSSRLGSRVLVRPHPGRGPESASTAVERLGLDECVEFDNSADGAHVIGEVNWVLSAHSTVLFEALILGLVPVAVRSDCFERGLPFRHEAVDVRLPMFEQLAGVLSRETRARYRSDVADEGDLDRFVGEIVDGLFRA